MELVGRRATDWWLDAQLWGLRLLGRLGRDGSRGRALPEHLRTGLRGEEEALFALRKAGYTIVARRWTSPKVRGDVDLIGWEDGWLCFIEVKTRTARDLSPAESAVDAGKQRQIRGLARTYVKALSRRSGEGQGGAIPVRFDVISVYLVGGQVETELFRGAFGWT